jgi:D-serine deaminase-like pyridoxal phosphate-dependent protein
LARAIISPDKSIPVTLKPAWGDKRQLDAGAIGVAVAKVGEAEVMAAIDNLDILVAYEALCAVGLCPPTVSSGSTPSVFNTHLIRHVTEIRIGTAVYNDYYSLKFHHCTLQQCAARVVATAVSDVVPDQAIIDAGAKALSAKQLYGTKTSKWGISTNIPRHGFFVSTKNMDGSTSAVADNRRGSDSD